MKAFCLLMVLPLLLGSCKTSLSAYLKSYAMGNSPAKSSPFVQLQDKEKIEAKTVRERSDSVITDRQAFPKRDVDFYSDGYNIYGKLRNQKFATKIIDGDLSIYSASYPFKGKHGISYLTKYYIGKEGSNDIDLFTYHSVKKMIQPGDSGYEYLKLFRKNRLWWNLGFYGGMAIEFTGVGIGSGGKEHAAVIGNTLMFAGICSVLTSAIELELNNRQNVQRSVARHNGALP